MKHSARSGRHAATRTASSTRRLGFLQRVFIEYVVALGSFVVFDMIWMSMVMKEFYETALSGLLRVESGVFAPDMMIGLAVYLCLALGLILFAVEHPPSRHETATTILRSSVMGLVVYGVYELTNFAVLASWPFELVLVDLAWGIALCAMVGTVVLKVRTLLQRGL
jgi:uncharacterized membrane protein